MKISMNWIRQYADIPVTPAEYESRMIMHGTGVEGIEYLGAECENVVVGKVLSCRDHENSDHLHVCMVDVGQGEPLQIVCGAPNVKEGILVPVALVGAKLPGGHEIKKGKLRGVESCGMLCSGPEIGVPVELYPSVGDAGLLIFNEDYPLGADVRGIFGLDDHVVDFEILANRPDCLCAWGIARETAAVLGTALRIPKVEVQDVGGDVREHVQVRVEDFEKCPHYTARVIKNVRVAPSPLWIRQILHAAGMRSINNIVDITNLVMLETGHPMHAFDLDKVRGHEIIVRTAKEGEVLRTLDGKDHALTTSDLLICDAEGPTGLAGIMGGEESEITDGTREVMFECATFDRAVTRLSARRMGIRTESSGRFERGVSAATVMTALERACQLVNLLDAGDVVGGCYDLHEKLEKPQPIVCSVKRLAARTGVAITADEMVNALEKLNFTVVLDGDTLTVTAPDYRQDVERDADICEEVLRMVGYDRIPSTRLRGETTPGGLNPRLQRQQRLRGLLSGLGYDEIMTFSFVSKKSIESLGLPEDDPRMQPILVRNPLGEDTACMRTTLAPDMLRILSGNYNRGNECAMLYEFGTLFDGTQRTAEGLFPETPALALGAYGKGLDFYALRGAVEALCAQEGVGVKVVPGADRYYHPGRSARLMHGQAVIAQLGQVHPDVAQRYDLPEETLIAEIDLSALAEYAAPMGTVAPISRMQAVSRDIALVMDSAQPLGPVMDALRAAAGPLLEDIRLFDVFRGAQVGLGKKSAAFTLTFRSPDQTLTDETLSPLMKKILKVCKEKFDAEIRS
ncbi:MAG: phenylalanine--tRNA ligase subunit beta [Clostridia bacterium]|nr:phenylalanine--tRNA ligase subunit beta [Clostridia bacterium]